MAELKPATRIGYSLGSFVTGAFGTVPGLLLLPYLTDTMAVPAAAAGAIVLLPKAWDVVFNPIAGRISDADRVRTGGRLRSIVFGGIAVAVLFAALFAHPGFGSVGADSAYVVVVFFLCATGYAFFQVPYNALPAELTDGYHERTRLTSWRIAVLALAILVSGAVAPVIADGPASPVAGYRLMGLFVAVLLLAGTVGVYFGIRRAPTSAMLAPTPGWRALFATMRRWRAFRCLLAVYFVQALGIATLLAGVSYLATHVLGDAGLRSALFAGFVGPALLVMPVWERLGRRWGKLAGFRFSTVLFAAALAALALSRVVPLPAVFVFVALAGVGYAGIQVYPLAILPDLITAEERRTGEARAGVAAGVWTASETLGLALGPGLFGLVLSLGGYVSSAGEDLTQPDGAVTAITVGSSILPAVLVLAALPLLPRRVLPGETARGPRQASPQP